jgi:hypothetical protein
METNYSNRIVNVSDYKISLTKLMEENNRRMQEHYQKTQTLKKKQESQKQTVNEFVCDWQTI